MFGFEEMFQEEMTERERVFWVDRLTCKRARKASKWEKISYLILLEITARLLEHNRCILK